MKIVIITRQRKGERKKSRKGKQEITTDS